MAEFTPIDHFVHGLMNEYKPHIRQSGAYGGGHLLPPDLSNEILPMFKERWVTGWGQHTPEIYEKIKPALRLASRLLTEDWPLMWFCHLTFGERRRGPNGVYIVPIAYLTSSEALAQVKANIRAAGEVTSFMWAPPGFEDNAYGSTGPDKRERNFYCNFGHSDWPPIRHGANRRYAQPLVVMNSRFQNYFLSRYSRSSIEEFYRVSFLLGITFAHEFTHAYNMWLTPEFDEPLWSASDKIAELGWSWENTVIGFGLHDADELGDPRSKFNHLYQTKTIEYCLAFERDCVYHQLAGTNRTYGRFTKCDASGYKAKPPAISAHEFRGSEYFIEDDHRRDLCYMAALQIVPMKWIADWFSEQHWAHKKRYWDNKGMYVRPTLGNAFMVLYEVDGRRASTMRPLVPGVTVDREIIKGRMMRIDRR